MVVKGIQVCSLKQSESKEPQPRVQFKCKLHTWSARSARFVEKPNTFLGWEVELELAPGRVGVGDFPGDSRTSQLHGSILP